MTKVSFDNTTKVAQKAMGTTKVAQTAMKTTTKNAWTSTKVALKATNVAQKAMKTTSVAQTAMKTTTKKAQKSPTVAPMAMTEMDAMKVKAAWRRMLAPYMTPMKAMKN